MKPAEANAVIPLTLRGTRRQGLVTTTTKKKKKIKKKKSRTGASDLLLSAEHCC
jgi:hypothetical protein